MRHHGLVEVDPAEAFDALGLTHRHESVADTTHDGRVERATAEVVDRDDAAFLDPLARREVHRGRLGLGDEPRAGHPGNGGCLFEELTLVRPPVGWMGDRDRGRRPTLALGDGVDDVPDDGGHQALRRVRRVPENDRRGVAEPPLELACQPGRLLLAAARGGIADEQFTVVTQQHGGRDRRGVVAQSDDLDPAIAGHRGGRERGTEIDPEGVTHATSDSSGLRNIGLVECFGRATGTCSSSTAPDTRP